MNVFFLMMDGCHHNTFNIESFFFITLKWNVLSSAGYFLSKKSDVIDFCKMLLVRHSFVMTSTCHISGVLSFSIKVVCLVQYLTNTCHLSGI
jgi:hypothetical protein